METISALLLNAAGFTRRSYLHSREYLVAPVTMIVPGVLAGSDGPLFYPQEEVSKNPSDWNHVPLVAPKHPTMNGVPVSARSPEILEEYGVGMVLRSSYKDKLQAEAWFDVERCQRVDKRLLPMVQNGSKIEISTGLFLQKTASAGVHNGVNYSYVTSAYKPDHLAILLDEVGACGTKDGCGIHVNSEGKPVDNLKLSHADIRVKLAEKLREKFGYKTYEDDYQVELAYLIDVFDREFVFSNDGKLWRSKYKTDNRTGMVEISGEPVVVDRVISYKPVTNQGDAMNRDQMITWLTTNCECWKGDGKEDLEKLTDNTIKVLKDKAEETQALVANAIKKPFVDSLGNTHTYDEVKKEWTLQPKAVEKKVETPVDNKTQPALTPEQQEDLAFARRIKAQWKQGFVSRITANSQNKFTPEQLERFDLQTLENMAELATVKTETPTQPMYPLPSYGGANVPPTHNTHQVNEEDTNAVVIPPVTNYSELFANRK